MLGCYPPISDPREEYFLEHVSEELNPFAEDERSQTLSEELPAESKTTESLKEHRKQVKRKRRSQQEQDPSLGRDVAGWLAILCGIAWLLILVSYDPSDPSLLNQTSKMVPENYLGSVGANIAAYSYQFFGFGNFAFPLGALYLGYLFIRTKRVNDWFFQVIGGGTVILVFMVLMGSFSTIPFKGDDLMPGGIVGVMLWRFFTGYLNPFGTYLFLFGATGLALLIATQLTLLQIGTWIYKALQWLKARAVFAFSWLRQRLDDTQRDRGHQRIIKRELDKMESEKREKVRQRLQQTEPDAFENEPLIIERDTADQLGIVDEDLYDSSEPEPEPYPVPESDFSEELHEDGTIKVNPMKITEKGEQGSFQFMQEANTQDWVYPTTFHFNKKDESQTVDESELREKARSLSSKLAEFNVTGDMREIHPGPVVTTYEFRPDAGIKYSKIVNLAEDLCLALGAESVRIDRMPGKYSVGIEVPNNKRELITFREMIESQSFQNSKSKLSITLGKTIDGTPFSVDLAKMPHLLIAGQTGSGKSVGINAMICSILMRASPAEAKLILIDPKMVELGMYADIPHLLTPVVTDPHQAANALKWAVDEMERRYKLLAANHFRNLDHYNNAVRGGKIEVGEFEEPLEVLPSIVVVMDEMADLMMVARGEVEESVARLAQKSRAIGIHLVLATQRPSVDIITGVIKSNLPARLAYRVAQRNDSRIILDGNGADQLLGKGDGLFLGPGTARMIRIHAPYLTEMEVLDLVKYLKNQGEPNYNKKVLEGPRKEDGFEKDSKSTSKKGEAPKPSKSHEDPMYGKAARLVVRSGQASVSYLQRKLSLGYARAAKLIDMMEEDGIVGPNLGSKARDILVSSDFFDAIDNQ